MARLSVALCVLALASAASAYNNGLGRLPPLGFNTWCTDDICGIIDRCHEDELRSIADAMVAGNPSMKSLGYEYINMDDCWSATTRDADNNLMPDPKLFPSGMKALADYIHDRGLKFGLYTCIGTETCHGGRPGSFGFYDQDAKTLAAWGMDFVKTDNCHKPSGYTEQELYANFSRALNATGRPMLFSLCEWGDEDVPAWGGSVAQMYRIQMDHLPFWHMPTHAAGSGTGQGTIDIIEYVATLTPSTFVRPFAWMDPDFLETLFPVTMNFIDSRTEYSFWSLWSAPLLVSTDVRNMTAEKQSILLNPEVLAIDQDPAGIAGDRIYNLTNGAQAWSKTLDDGDLAVILFNSGNHKAINVSITWQQLGWPPATGVAIRDLWARKTLGVFTQGYEATNVAPHDVAFLRLTKQQT